MAAAFAVGRHDAAQGVVALTVVGELDIVSGDILARMTLAAVAGDVNEVVVDLARVTWLDAAGVDALLLGHGAAVRAGCTYRVANPSGLVQYVLEITDRERRLHVRARGWTGG
jgi:anti-sigma B factor antagonist